MSASLPLNFHLASAWHDQPYLRKKSSAKGIESYYALCCDALRGNPL